MTPDELLELLKTKSNARKQRSLDIISGICKEQLERGSRDFSIATIGRLSSEQGGPSPQTIRNKGGDDFRALIATWAEHSKGAMKKPPRIQESGISSILEKINDPAVRSIVGSILAAGPNAVGECKKLIDYVGGAITKQMRHDTAAWLARVRVGDEAQSRMNAFLRKR